VSVHSGHKIALKATAVASDHMKTGLWNPTDNKYDYVKDSNSFEYVRDYGAGGWDTINTELSKLFMNCGWGAELVLSSKALKKIAVR
jgi:hypothetical protein